MVKITDRLWKKAAVEKIPLTGAFELLPVCNLKCKMCYVRQSMEMVLQQGGILSAEQWLDYASQAAEEGMLYPLLTGGEPFLHPEFQKIYMGMKQLGQQISINSNGTLIDETTARWLGKNPPVKINITLYGVCEETYEKLCGNGAAFENVQKAAEYLKRYHVPMKLNASMTPENAGELEKMIQYAKSLDVPIQVASYMFPPIRRDETMIGKNHRLSPREAARVRVMADWLQGDREWFAGQAKRFEKFIPVSEAQRFQEKKNLQRKMTCRAGRSSFWLDWKGNLGNCGMHTSHPISLKDKSFREAWRLINEETEKFCFESECSACLNDKICHVCLAMLYNETGNLERRPAYLCEMNQASAEYYQEFMRSDGAVCKTMVSQFD